jgi:hypothetical protein
MIVHRVNLASILELTRAESMPQKLVHEAYCRAALKDLT